MNGYWPEGMPTSIDYPALSVGELCTVAARLYGERTVVIDGDERLTFRELHEQAAAVANALRERGVRNGDVVVLHLPNGLWFPVVYYGVLLAGATVSPANPLQPAPALHNQLVDTGAVVAFSHPAQLDTLNEARTGSDLREVVVVPVTACAPSEVPVADSDDTVGLADFVAGQSTSPPQCGVRAEDLAHIAYTGGTTGVPKGVRVLHRNVVANVTQTTAWRAGHRLTGTSGVDGDLRPIPGMTDVGLRPGSVVSVVVSPLFHAQALMAMHTMLLCGTTFVFSGRFSPEGLLELIEQHGVTYITGSPAMWHALLDSPDLPTREKSSIQSITSGAAPIEAATLEGLQAAFPSAVIAEGYGLTEATCAVSVAPFQRGARRKLGSVGLPLFDTTVQIRAADGTVLGPNEPGELWVHGPQVTDGYFNAPEATAAQFADGWLRTGDVGYLDDDGFVYISDRAKDMLIYKGYNVYPRELEDILACHPDVSVAAVVGRQTPRVGQEPVAFVVPRPGTQVDPEEVTAFVAAKVLPYKKIREVRVVDALPTTAAGKIAKTELRALTGLGSR